MSSLEVDYDALEATTSIEEITGYELNQNTLRSLKSDELSDLWLCAPDLAMGHGDYILFGSTELGWLGHFTKKSTRLDKFGIYGGGVFDSCSGCSANRFLEDVSKCHHIEKMHFIDTDLTGVISKLGPAMKSNNITHLDVDGCYMGVPGAIFLFHTLRDMNSLEELRITCELDDALNGAADMEGCIPSLATCTGMRKLVLNGLNLSTNSCDALSAVFPRMAALLELHLCENLIDDDCVEVLVRGLAECKQLQSLNLRRNRLSDNGLEILIQWLPANVNALDLEGNEVTLARQLPLLRFKELDFSDNTLCPGGPQVIAASLANPECRLELLDLISTAVGDEGAAILAPSLRNNQRLARMTLEDNSITETGWDAFSSILCDASSINATHGSNHTLQELGFHQTMSQDIDAMLELNSDQDKSGVAASKILLAHRHLDMRPFFGMELDLLPRVVAWLDRFAESRPDLKLSSIFDFVRAMPMKVTDRLCKDMGKSKGEKRKLNNE